MRNLTCRLLASSFANAFLTADKLVHLDPETDWTYIQGLKSDFMQIIGTLQAHLGDEIKIKLGVELGKVEQGISTHDLLEINFGAEKIQKIILSDGLVAIVEECSRRED